MTVVFPEPHPFSPAGRTNALRAMARDGVDLLVIGGGITGCGVARDAALRGWRVGLVEKVDFGFGTSSRSSKIVHGGVRYLEYGHFLLVRESARERIVPREIAPHLVHRMDFLYPVFAPDSLLRSAPVSPFSTGWRAPSHPTATTTSGPKRSVSCCRDCATRSRARCSTRSTSPTTPA